MLVELLSSSNKVSFNIKLANIIGLHPAIYLEQLIDINEKALRKSKLEDNYFVVDRKYIQSRTTFASETQLELEETLAKIGIVEYSDLHPGKLSLNLTVFTSMMMTPDESLLKDISNLSKKKTSQKASKTKIYENQAKSAVTTMNPELRKAYFDWIEAVIIKDGFMIKNAVTSAQIAIDKYTDHDLDMALKILNIATINAYRDMTWAIRNYEKDGDLINRTSKHETPAPAPVNIPMTRRKVRVSDEVF